MNNAVLNVVLQSLLFICLASVFILLVLPVFTAWHSQNPDNISRHLLVITDSVSGSQRAAIERTRKLLESGIGNIELEIVAFDRGVSLLNKGSQYHKDIKLLLDKGVVFTVCQKSLDLLGSDRTLYIQDGVKIVSDGSQYAEYLKDQGYIDELG